MTIIDDLTPTQYGLGGGKLVVRGTTVGNLEFQLFVHFFNEADQPLDQRYVPLTFTTAQKQVFIDVIAAEIASLAAATGLTQYVAPEIPSP